MINGVIKNESETPSFVLTVTFFVRDESMAKRDCRHVSIGQMYANSVLRSGHPLSLYACVFGSTNSNCLSELSSVTLAVTA